MRDEQNKPHRTSAGRLGLRLSPSQKYIYCWFSHDVTKIQTKNLSIVPRFYFHEALEQLKTNFDTNFRFKRALGFVMVVARWNPSERGDRGGLETRATSVIFGS